MWGLWEVQFKVRFEGGTQPNYISRFKVWKGASPRAEKLLLGIPFFLLLSLCNCGPWGEPGEGRCLTAGWEGRCLTAGWKGRQMVDPGNSGGRVGVEGTQRPERNWGWRALWSTQL